MNDLHESVNYLIISWVLMEMIMLDMSGCTLLAWCEVGKEAKRVESSHFIPTTLCNYLTTNIVQGGIEHNI